MHKISHWTMERAILALLALLLCASPILARSGKVIKPLAPNTPGLQRGARSLNLTPLAQHRQSQARMRPLAATHLRPTWGQARLLPQRSIPAQSGNCGKTARAILPSSCNSDPVCELPSGSPPWLARRWYSTLSRPMPASSVCATPAVNWFLQRRGSMPAATSTCASNTTTWAFPSGAPNWWGIWTIAGSTL